MKYFMIDRFYKNCLICLALCFSIASCSLLKEANKKFEVKSNPKKAKVYYLNSKTQSFEKLGETPLILSKTELKKLSELKQRFVALKIEKPGFIGETVFVDKKSSYNFFYTANLKKLEIWHNPEDQMSSRAANSLAKKVQIINNNILKKQYAQALKQTNFLLEQFPNANVFYDMKGSIYYMMGKFVESKNSFLKSLKINPDNKTTRSWVEKLNKRGI